MSGKGLTVGIVGCGNMGAALAMRLPQGAVLVHDVETAKQAGLVRRAGANVSAAACLADLVEASDIILIAVKPQDIDPVLAAVRGRPEKLVISIAAGITLAHLEKAVAGTVVVRAMPNLNALIGRSVTALSFSPTVDPAHQANAKRIFQAVGAVVIVPDEQMNAVTAVSGSGPAFVAYLRDILREEEIGRALQRAAQELGIETSVAERLARGTVSGTAAILESRFEAAALVECVASKGGTTEAGLEVLKREGKTPEALVAAVHVACRRAAELSRS